MNKPESPRERVEGFAVRRGEDPRRLRFSGST